MALQIGAEMINYDFVNLNGKPLTDRSDIKILVVDDREDNLFSTETILEQDGYTIVTANSGRAALKILLKEHDFSLMLMDVQMPDMNGLETARMIYERQKLRDIPIIFITAHNYNDDFIFKGYKMGGVDYLYKPVNPDLLRLKVSVFVELYRKNQQLLHQEEILKKINVSLQREIEEKIVNEEKIRSLNEQLVLNNNDLRSTIEELDRFAYVASHDLQEPLRKIILFSEKLSSEYARKEDTNTVNYVNKIVKASLRMQDLINDLLKFSLQSHTESDFSLISLKGVVEEVLADLDIDIQQKKASVKVGELPEVMANKTQMHQLFQNLIGNSLKFCKKGVSPVIEVCRLSARPGSEEENDMPGKKLHKIMVRDNGIGFDSKYKDDIFTVFKRLHSYHEVEGTGIGLSICKKILEKHQGTIEADSTLGNGATFILTLPGN